MIRIMTRLLLLALVACIGYLFFSGNIAGAIVTLMGSAILIPLIMHITNGGFFSGSALNDSTHSSSGVQGGADGGADGASGGDGC